MEISPLAQAILTVLASLIVGIVTAYIAIRKMPAEIGVADSQRKKNLAETGVAGSATVRNLLESNKMLSDQLRQQQEEIGELRTWFTGGIEIVTKLELSNPPKVLAATVKRIPIISDSG